MKCYYHPESDAVAQCKECGRYLCKECSDKYMAAFEEVLCEDCAQKRFDTTERDCREAFAQEKKDLIRSSIIGAVIAIFAAGSGGLWYVLAFFLPFGWFRDETSSLEKAIRSSGSSGGAYVFGRIIGFFIKLLLCTVLGIPMFIKKIISFYHHQQIMKDNGWL